MTYDEFAAGIVRYLALDGPLGGAVANIVVLERTGSTNDLAREVARRTAEDELALRTSVYLAHQQVAGRGRRGRRWETVAGGTVCATVSGFVPTAHVVALPAAVAVALADGVSRYTRESCRLKWPNDLLVSDGKIGGILIDALAHDSERTAVQVGFGVNHGELPPGIAAAGATSLERVSDSPPELDRFAAELAGGVVASLAALEESAARHEVMERYRRALVHRPGDPIRFRTDGAALGSAGESEGVERVGEYVTVDDSGRLCVLVDGEERYLAAAEIERLETSAGAAKPSDRGA